MWGEYKCPMGYSMVRECGKLPCPEEIKVVTVDRVVIPHKLFIYRCPECKYGTWILRHGFPLRKICIFKLHRIFRDFMQAYKRWDEIERGKQLLRAIEGLKEEERK